MRVTIITIVRNDAAGIVKTINSVARQTYANIEYIVLDGASSDGTIDAVRKLQQHVTTFISEPDGGISDAWNKAIAMATGEVIGLLNAADEYAPDVVQRAVQAIESGLDVVYGDVDLVDRDGILIRHCPGRFSLWFYSGGIGFYHPSLLCRAAVYRDIGLFNPGMKLAMDTDWIVRAYQSGARFGKKGYRVRMEASGVSVQRRYTSYGEHLDSLKRNGVSDQIIALGMIMTGLRRMAAAFYRPGPARDIPSP